VFEPENIEILDKATSNFKIRLKEELHIITHTSLNSKASMQLHTKENTIKICSSPIVQDPNNITEQLERLYVHYYQHTSLTL
jgi:hypothetical protein